MSTRFDWGLSPEVHLWGCRLREAASGASKSKEHVGVRQYCLQVVNNVKRCRALFVSAAIQIHVL